MTLIWIYGSGHWAYNVINRMTEKGILNGYPDGTFKPDQHITRAEISKIMVLTLGLSGKSGTNFIDVDSSFWGYDFINVSSKYLSGYYVGGAYSFFPNDSAVREDVAVAMVRAMKLDTKEYDLSILDRFSDRGDISNDATKYIAIAVENSLMRGNAAIGSYCRH